MNAAPAGLALWVLFLVSWWSAALWTGKAVSRGAIGLRLAYFAGFALGFGLLFLSPDAAHPFVRRFAGGGVPVLPLWRTRGIGALVLMVAEMAGFAFAWWARVRLWSGMLTLREGHRVVDSGPFPALRRPRVSLARRPARTASKDAATHPASIVKASLRLNLNG